MTYSEALDSTTLVCGNQNHDGTWEIWLENSETWETIAGPWTSVLSPREYLLIKPETRATRLSMPGLLVLRSVVWWALIYGAYALWTSL